MIQLHNVTKTYSPPASRGGVIVAPVLDSIDWSLDKGDTAVIRGESGSGKTTLLNLIAGLDRPTSGEIHVAGHRLDTLDDDSLAEFRLNTIGLVFQDYHLESRLTALANVSLPLLLADIPRPEAARRAREALSWVRMDSFADTPVALLSGGQCQRVVVARALVRRPALLLADEPTANLDEDTARLLIQVFEETQRRDDTTLVLVSHDRLALEHPGWRRFLCRDGSIVPDFESSDSLEK